MSLNCIADLPLAIAKAEEVLKINNCDKPPIDPSDIARKIGIKVMDCSFENPNISGYYDFDEKTIYVNRNEFVKRQQFTIAHELGHAILHEDWVNSSEYTCLYRDQFIKATDDIKELEANEFAGHLLVPSFLLNKYYEELKTSEEYLIEDILQKISDVFFVSIPVIKIRLMKEYGYTSK